MLVCPKCLKRFEAGSQICRDCGAILKSAEEAPMEERPQPAVWQCPKCREAIEANFETCWNCGTSRDGVESPAFAPVGKGSSEMPGNSRKIPNAGPCRRCGSAKVIPNAIIGDQGQYSDGKLKAQVIGNPGAWIFKNIERAELLADICGECGHVELKVSDPGLLYEHYLQSVEESG
jgi:hypothetical protein